MGNVIADITMSLDGFIDGPNDGLARLHQWLFSSPTPQERTMIEALYDTMGAVLMGRGTFDDGVNKNGWGGWVDEPPFPVTIFVLSHSVPEKIAQQNGFVFVTDGITSALQQAQAVAGDKNVIVMGGANLIQQYLAAGLVNEIHLHVVPVLLGEGIRLFGDAKVEMEQIGLMQSPAVTHLRFRIVK